MILEPYFAWVGVRHKELRETFGLEQVDVAFKFKCNIKTIQRSETGKRTSYDLIKKICTTFKIDATLLMDSSDEAFNNFINEIRMEKNKASIAKETFNKLKNEVKNDKNQYGEQNKERRMSNPR